MHTYRNLDVTVNNAGRFHLHPTPLHPYPWYKHHSVVFSNCFYILLSVMLALICSHVEVRCLSFVVFSVLQKYLKTAYEC